MDPTNPEFNDVDIIVSDDDNDSDEEDVYIGPAIENLEKKVQAERHEKRLEEWAETLDTIYEFTLRF